MADGPFTKIAEQFADKFSPKIYRDSGKLDSDFHWTETRKAVERAIQLAVEKTWHVAIYEGPRINRKRIAKLMQAELLKERAGAREK